MGKKIFLQLAMRRACGIIFLLLSGAGLGCQSWQSSAALPGLTTTRAQRKVLQHVERDPFPSPGDVGMDGTDLDSP